MTNDASNFQESKLLLELASAEARFRKLIELAPDAIVIANKDGEIVLVNGQTEVLFAYSREELLGQPVELLLPERFRGSHVGRRSGYVGSPSLRPMGAGLELFGRRKDGSEFPVEISLGPIEDDDGGLVVLSTIRDITERKRVEAVIESARREAEQANDAKSEFLSRMSHELRTPLNAILGFGQLLALDSLQAEQHDSVKQILGAGKHLLELINEVLDISRIEAGKLSLSMEPVPVDDLLRQTQDLIRPLAIERNVRLQEQPRTLHLHVLADHQRLRQVMLNLLTNAIKYNRQGGIVTLSVEEVDAKIVRIAVRDTGAGLTPEEVNRLFIPFERLGAEQSDVEGTGLGLALSKRLIEAMGGSMAVESSKGQGARFWFDLPLAQSVVPQIDFSQARHALQMMPTVAQTVLYIEDNLASYQLMERIFSFWPGVELISAMQGRIGLDLAILHKPDLILLDLHLPDIQGLEVLQHLRANASTSAIPVIVTSADATSGQIERLRAAGANDYLTKPLDIPRLAEVIRQHIQ